MGSNLYALGVSEKVIQAILRHANVSTTNTYYIKTRDAQTDKAMTKLERTLPKVSNLVISKQIRMEALGRVELPTNGLGNRCSIH